MSDETTQNPEEGNEDLFRQLTGAGENSGPTEEEVQEAKERLETGEGTMGDLGTALGDIVHERQQFHLKHFGLKPVFTEEEEEHSEAMFELMSEEQDKLYHRAMNIYMKRGFPIHNENDKMDDLAAFAATNPPSTLRRHLWRLQRGLDEPFWGKEKPPQPNKVWRYAATTFVHLCTNCAKELERETEEAGAERKWNRDGKFYDPDLPLGFYLFRYEDCYVNSKKTSLAGDDAPFPVGTPRECQRCGVNDVEIWREHFGEG